LVLEHGFNGLSSFSRILGGFGRAFFLRHERTEGAQARAMAADAPDQYERSEYGRGLERTARREEVGNAHDEAARPKIA
jgi:hypothetical protein